MSVCFRACAVLSLVVLQGCSLVAGGVKVEPVAVSTQRPGNVALYVAVSQNGSGVTGLEDKDFKVYENGVPLDNRDIQLTLLPTEASTARHAAVLVDMSKSLKPAERKSLAEALRPFIVRLRQREAVSLYAFDGSEKVHLVQEYPRDARAEPDEKDTSMERLLSFSRRDASTSLYSAVVDGAQKLSASLAAEGRPIQNGTLIVIALNPDSAGRVQEGQLRDFVDRSPHHFFLMTVGTTASAANLSFIGKNGQTRAGSAMTMGAPLNDVANAVDDDVFRNYLVSYCSPGRAGERDLRLQVTTHDAQGKPRVGSYETRFDASGFGPGCNSQAAPHFVVAQPKPEPVVEFSGKPAKGRVASSSRSSKSAKNTSTEPATSVPPSPAGASPASPAAAPAAAPAPQASSDGVIAEPPSGLGYE